MLTNAKVAKLFNINEDNISAYSSKKTANLRWETVVSGGEGRTTLQQEQLIIVHLKRIIWSEKLRRGASSKLQLSYWEDVPTHYPQKDGCIVYE